MRTLGSVVFVAGIVYFAIGLVVGGGFYFALFGELIEVAGAVSILAYGLSYGPVLIAVGLGLLYVSARRRERAAVSS